MTTDLMVHRQLELPVMQEERGMQLQVRMTGSTYMKHMAAAVVCAVLVLCCAPVYAGDPMKKLEVSFDKALAILNDVSLKAPEMRQQRRDMLREVANCMFAWEEMSKRSMGTYWRERTPEERNEFIKLFSDLLENTYMTKIESYSGEKILYSNESIEGQYAMVQTKIIIRQGVEVPVNYFMMEKNGSWLVYDVSIEGISIVKNYRSQINEILSRSSYPELIKKLKEKQVASQVPAV